MIDGIHYKVKELSITNGQYRFKNVEVLKTRASLDIQEERARVSFPLRNIICYLYELEAK